MNDKTIEAITVTVDKYFQGTFYPEKIGMLKQAFHPDAHIVGKFNGQYIDLPLQQFVSRVEGLHEDGVNKQYKKKIIAIDVVEDTALVKAKVLVGDEYFVDLITLIEVDGQWLIRHKSFTNKS